jgi:hypothetical protein
LSRKPVSIEVHVGTTVFRYDLDTEKQIPVTPQEFYDEVHSFMNRYGWFLKLQMEAWEEDMHHLQELPEGMEDVDGGKWNVKPTLYTPKVSPGKVTSRSGHAQKKEP